jgi:hypothetical protein
LSYSQRLLAYEITETQTKSKPRLCLTENILLPVLSFQTGENLGNSLQVKRFQKNILLCPTGFQIYYFNWFTRLKSRKKGILSFI